MPTKNLKILFASDMHGNKGQYEKLFKYAHDFDIVIIGGDITPKDSVNRTAEGQKKFLLGYLFPKIKDFQKSRKRSVYIITGNDDFKSNESLLKKSGKSSGFKLINNTQIVLDKNTVLAGYPYVPLTPFVNKDWERLDLAHSDESEKRKDIVLYGKETHIDKILKVKFDIKKRKYTIEKDLRTLLNNPKGNKIILVSHSPPFDTNLDIVYNHSHVGSKALRKIILEKKPLVVLCGHIHETVRMSGEYMDRIGKTVCLSTGNDYMSEKVSLIEFRINSPEKARRKII